jgi:hypothetical protein
MGIVAWLPTFAFQAALLMRALRDMRLLKYRFFYLYIAVDFVGDSFVLPASAHFSPETYAKIYWRYEFGSDLLACGILYEMCRYAFSNCPQAKVFARTSQVLIWLTAVGSGCIYFLKETIPRFPRINSFAFSRDMLTSQAIVLVVLIGGVLYFGIPLGKNLWGLVLGFGLQIGGVAGVFASDTFFRPFYDRFAVDLMMLVVYGALIIWLVTLWNYHPDPVIGLDQVRVEYQRVMIDRIRGIKEFVLAFLTAPFKPILPS